MNEHNGFLKVLYVATSCNFCKTMDSLYNFGMNWAKSPPFLE